MSKYIYKKYKSLMEFALFGKDNEKIDLTTMKSRREVRNKKSYNKTLQK